jgi:hypothetical protein
MDDFGKYERLREAGVSPKDVYLTAKADGFDAIRLLRLLRKVFALSLSQAKEVTLIAERAANSLDEFQEDLASQLEKAMDQEEHDGSVNSAPIESTERGNAGSQGPSFENYVDGSSHTRQAASNTGPSTQTRR